MESNKENPFLYFNFANHNGKVNPLQFKDPLQILIARKVNEIIPCMKVIQQAVHNGYYAAGYISYEAAPAFNKDFHVKKDNIMPLLWFGIFSEPVNKELELTIPNDSSTTDWKPTVSVEDYQKNFDHIQDLIKDSYTQQVNYTIPFETHFFDDPTNFFKKLEQAQAANYTAYINTEDFSVISASPELFFHLKNREIMTKPMKGTIGRGHTYEADLKYAEQLKSSKKDQAENRLIVDLMRSELEEIAIPGTINVPNLYTIEKYPTVYQMTSTITAKLQHNIELIDIFKALFPCGSITGMPKKDTMKIISQLETSPREVYCGAVGYITPHHEAIFNVPIRTVLVDKHAKVARYGVGGAITRDSQSTGEYEEILVKTRLLTTKQYDFKLLESLGLINGEYLVFNEHMKRLKESALYFDFKLNVNKIENDLMNIAKKHHKEEWKVRLLVEKDGNYSIEIENIVPFTSKALVKLSEHPIQKDNLFLYHKTTNRSVYEASRIQNDELFDTLLWNTDGEVTEFTTGNIVVELDNHLYTPPLHCGLLAGTFRSSLLEQGIIAERRIMIEELDFCTNIWLINSVRKWIPVQILSSTSKYV